jgi:HNH endonuclease
MAQGSVTKAGYRRVRVPGSRRLRMEHVVVWEARHGPIPPGMELHHRNRDKLDNRIENLQLVTRLEHKRLHGGCILVGSIWWKPCHDGGVLQPVDNYYRKPDGSIMSVCRGCAIRRAVRSKQRHRQRHSGQHSQVGDVSA